MILHAEDWQFLVPHSFHGAVIQVQMGHLHFRRKRIGVDRKTVILRSDRDFARLEILDRLVPAAMPRRKAARRAVNADSSLASETSGAPSIIVRRTSARFALASDS
jgi:hypothetical protein